MAQIAEATPGAQIAALPAPRGPLSEWAIDALESGAPSTAPDSLTELAHAAPWSDDVQLALFVCQEMHYRGWRGVDPALEWETAIIGARVRLEDAFLAAIGREIPQGIEEITADAALDELARESLRAGETARWLDETDDETPFLDYFAARSLYHLKEADPHAWAIPRLQPHCTAPFVAVEFDEYGGGRAADVHQSLYAGLLDSMAMDSGYLDYLDRAPAAAIAPVTLMSAFGLRRAELGATIGHFAATEVASPPGSARMLAALERIGAPAPARRFYREHVEADAVHEIVMREDVVGGLLAAEPDSERAVVRGIESWRLVEERLATALAAAWRAGKTFMRGV